MTKIANSWFPGMIFLKQSLEKPVQKYEVCGNCPDQGNLQGAELLYLSTSLTFIYRQRTN